MSDRTAHDRPTRNLLRRVLLLALGMLAGCASPAKQDKVTGQMFIVTRGSENIRLGLVEVSAIRLDSLQAHIAGSARAWNEGPEVRQQKRIAEAKSLLAVAQKELRGAPARAQANEIAYIRGDIPTSKYMGGQAGYTATVRMRVANLQKLLESYRAFAGRGPSAGYLFRDLPQPLATAKTDADGRFELMVPAGVPVAILAAATRETPGAVEKYHWMVRLNNSARQGTALLLSNDNLITQPAPQSLTIAWEGMDRPAAKPE